jgi:hypothetical protein
MLRPSDIIYSFGWNANDCGFRIYIGYYHASCANHHVLAHANGRNDFGADTHKCLLTDLYIAGKS